ncbi:glycosyltransferase family 2 protein [Rhodovulum adriaticum]|uniref:Glycosyl transferase family 2 n=1 Tax=Rhodovulum adriaticum TaxID=35804 RepID=A0A4R2NXL6_RHOAD|nr:glycosyltransferase family 2 protein [Rhodovulum adriaticum]TCP26331.1 glycosyl transferase family 2 [Rhodovulum adriaticum]
MKIALVATAKDEGPFLLEWVAYHRLAGFDPIIVFQNDSTDGTAAILTELDRIGAISYFDNPAKRGRHQIRAYTRAAKLDSYRAADWAMALDLDEFLCVKCGAGRVQDLLAAVPDTDQVLVNWRFFGAGGYASLSDRLVTERFTLCDRAADMSGELKAYKTLFRTALFERPGVHRVHPRDDAGGPLRTVNGSGLVEGAFEIKNFRSTDPGLLSLAQVNHYVLRDASSFLIKATRGSAHQPDRDLRENFWNRRQKRANVDQDRTLHDRAADIAAEMAVLDDQSGGRLGRLRQKALRHYAARLESLLEDPANRDLFVHCARTA